MKFFLTMPHKWLSNYFRSCFINLITLCVIKGESGKSTLHGNWARYYLYSSGWLISFLTCGLLDPHMWHFFSLWCGLMPHCMDKASFLHQFFLLNPSGCFRILSLCITLKAAWDTGNTGDPPLNCFRGKYTYVVAVLFWYLHVEQFVEDLDWFLLVPVVHIQQGTNIPTSPNPQRYL